MLHRCQNENSLLCFSYNLPVAKCSLKKLQSCFRGHLKCKKRDSLKLSRLACRLLTQKATFSLTFTITRVTHHTKARMPIVCATGGVCKFHTCPIILSPSLPSALSPSLPFLFCAFSLFTHAPPPLIHSTPHTEQLEEQIAALSC